MEGYVVIVGPRKTAEDAVGVTEGIEELQGRSGVGSAGRIHVCTDRPVVGVDFEAGCVVDDNAQIAWRAAFTDGRLDMETLDIMTLLGIMDRARVLVCFAGEGLGEGVGLGRLEDPDGLVEDL